MKRLLLCLTLGCLAALHTTAQKRGVELVAPLPQEWPEDEIFIQTTPADDLWWRKFEDELLDSLMIVATERNLSVLTAMTNIRIAKAGWRMTQSGLLPSVDLSAGWSRNKASGNLSQTGDTEAWYGYYTSTLSASWQVDVFGKIFKRAQAQKRAFQATSEEFRAVMLTLCAEVASNYFSLRQCQAEMEVLQRNVQSQKEIMEIVEARFETGFASKLDVAQARSVYYSTLASIPSMEANIRQYINSLTVLLGLFPGSIDGRLAPPYPLPDFTDAVAVGVPANLLRRRPDVRAAELSVESKAALLGATKRDWLPSFYLNGSIGYSANSIRKLFREKSLVWEIAPTMTLNLFDGGHDVAATMEAKAELEQSIIAFNNVALTAVQEVDNAMSMYRNSLLTIEALKETVRQGEETLELSLELYKQGLTQFQNVLDAQRSLLSSQDNLVQTRGYSLLSLVQLYKALGGGW
jgi:NodT family efflux transporter outer membrane factor (OMF) lipoprotein